MNHATHRHRAYRSGKVGCYILAVGVLLAALVFALLTPAVRVSREAARRVQCSNHLKQLGLALHHYHDTHGHFPAAMGGTEGGETDRDSNQGRLSGFVGLLPFLEQEEMWNQIAAPMEIAGQRYPAMGPAPWDATYPPWKTELFSFLCPSVPYSQPDIPATSYAFSIGDITQQLAAPPALRGVFAAGRTSRFDDIPDGIGNTIALAEIGGPCRRYVMGQFAIDQPERMLRNPSLCLSTAEENMYLPEIPLHPRGSQWADGAPGNAMFSTILPPNSPSCAAGNDLTADGIYSGGSFHPGGLQVLMTDGSMTFVEETIDAGDPTMPPPSAEAITAGQVPSPYGVWGALGTAAGAEDEFDSH